jgi:pimeloyl-ACP methyl ester carboxylesterase
MREVVIDGIEEHGDPPIAGERFAVTSSAGRVTVYVAGKGAPLLLIHSINAAASAAEVKPLIDLYQTRRQVFSLDLPGFGLSERSDRIYTPRLMTDAIRSVANAIRARNAQPIDALAVSLSCELLARAASEEPALFRALALVSPTGFAGRRALSGHLWDDAGQTMAVCLAERTPVRMGSCDISTTDATGRHSIFSEMNVGISAN